MTGWNRQGAAEHHARPGNDKASDKPAADKGHRGFGPPSADKLLEHADKNKDGKLTKDEVPEFMWTRLSTADTDKDGAVSKTELEEHFKKLPAPGTHGPGGHAFGGGHRPGHFGPGRSGFGGPHFGGPPSADKLFEHADKNKDGKLTKDELPGAAWERLSNADSDKDGSVSKAELEAHFKKHQEAFKSRTDKKPADKPAEKSETKTEEKPVEKAVEKPAEKTEEKPATEKPAEEKPAEAKTDSSAT